MSDQTIVPPDDLSQLRAARKSNKDAEVLGSLMSKYRERLRQMISLRMSRQLQSRLDASDVVQDTLVEASRTLEKYLADPKISVYLWLRHLANEKLIQAHRTHLGAQKRDASRDFSINGGGLTATSEAIAIQLVSNQETPDQEAEREDQKIQLAGALEKMDTLDREILTLRHFEHLNSKEIAELMGLKYEMVKKRYVRALDKLQRIMIDQ